MAGTTMKLRIADISTLDTLIGAGFPDPVIYVGPDYAREKAAALRALPALVGQRLYVVSRESLGPGRGGVTYQLRLDCPRTNLSHEFRASGWLGTTDNVHRQALGAWEVVGNSSTHLHLRAIDAIPAAFPAAAAVAAYAAFRRDAYAQFEVA